MPNWEGNKQIRLNEAILNLGSGITLSKGKDPITNQESYDLDSAGGGDFFRDLSFNLPDGVTDTTDSIRRDGEIGLLVDPDSTLDINGSVGYNVRSSTVNIIQGSSDRTVHLLLNGVQTYQLLAPSICPRREIVVVNPTLTAKNFTAQTYLDLSGVASTVIPSNSSITIQSDGVSWREIDRNILRRSVAIITASGAFPTGVDTAVINNGGINITITLPNALTVVGMTVKMSRGAGSTGTINVQGPPGNQIQAVNGTLGALTTLAIHGATGQGLNHSFTAFNIGGVGTWIRV